MAQITLNSTGVASSGALVLQSNGTTTAVTVSTGQVATFANDAVVNGLTVGRGAGAVSTNTTVGASALAAVTTADQMTAVGYQAAAGATTGNRLTAVGYQALGSTTTGAESVAAGRLALKLNTTGSNLVAVGHEALYSNTTASNNTAVGYQAGYSNTVGASCTFLGTQAGYLTTGGSNTFLGVAAGYEITTGTKNTIVGRYDGNEGGLDIRTASNHIVLSDGDGNPRMYFNSGGQPFYNNMRANAGTYTIRLLGSGEMVFDTSSARYKNNIRNSVYGLAAVMALKSRIFEYKDEPERTDVGLVAEEVIEVIPELVALNKENQPDAVHYDRFVSVLVKAIQELKAEFDAYKASHP
jgi:hypothetical protein